MTRLTPGIRAKTVHFVFSRTRAMWTSFRINFFVPTHKRYFKINSGTWFFFFFFQCRLYFFQCRLFFFQCRLFLCVCNRGCGHQFVWPIRLQRLITQHSANSTEAGMARLNPFLHASDINPTTPYISNLILN